MTDELPPVAGPNAESATSASARAIGATAAKADITRRRAWIAKLLGGGVPSGAIVARTVAAFGVSERTARGDLARVRDRWALEIAKDEPTRRARLLGVLDTVIAGAVADHAWGAAVAGCRELARICGLDAPTTVVVSGAKMTADDVELIRAMRFTNAERQAAITGLEREIATGDGADDEPGVDEIDDAVAVEPAEREAHRPEYVKPLAADADDTEDDNEF